MLPRKTRLVTLGPTYLEGAGHSGLVICSFVSFTTLPDPSRLSLYSLPYQ